MPGFFQKVLARLESQVCSREDVQVLIAPPLTKRAFRAQQRHAGLMPCSRRHREFAKHVKEVYGYDPAEYEERLCLPSLVNLKILREANVDIIPDASFADFDGAVRDPKYRLLFLVAHHMRHVGKLSEQERPGIEFADGGWPMDAVERSLELSTRSEPVSLVFAVCETQDFVPRWYKSHPSIGAVAFAGWELQLPQCIELVRRWVLQLDGRRTIAEAYDNVIDEVVRKKEPGHDS